MGHDSSEYRRGIKDILGIYSSSGISFGGLHEEVVRSTSHFDLTGRCSFLCVSGQRGTIAKSMYEEHLCVVALTSIERVTQFFPLASYFLV